jgi:heat shock protein HslJ
LPKSPLHYTAFIFSRLPPYGHWSAKTLSGWPFTMLRFFATLAPFVGFICLSCQSTAPVTTGSPTAASRPPAPGAALFETRWVLRQVGTQAVTVPEGGQEPYLLLRRTGAAEGQGSCNRFRSTAATDSVSHLIFTPLLSTRMSCPAIATEQAFTQALASTHSYRISGDTLKLYAPTEPDATPLARLEVVYLR